MDFAIDTKAMNKHFCNLPLAQLLSLGSKFSFRLLMDEQF